MSNPLASPLVCPHDHQPLRSVSDDSGTALACPSCGRRYPVDLGVADFAEGTYYDEFPGPEVLSPEQLHGLANEVQGTTTRVADFYGPLLRRRLMNGPSRPTAPRVLDSGCGNGLSIDLLSDAGFEAWGNDFSALRKWQWGERRHRERLVVADTRRLPFADGAFDAVISSGVIEHIGVRETGGEHYTVEPLPERDPARTAFLGELLRVLAPGGRLYVDCPNGAFPIDFWHGPRAGNARFHPLDEGFLPHLSEVRRIVAQLGPWRVRPLSPHKRLRMVQVGGHWYGKLFRWPMDLLLRAMTLPPLRPLAGTGLNPYLVMEIERAS